MNWESKEISGPRMSWTAPFPLQNMGQTKLKFGFQKVNGSKHCLSIPRQLHPPREPARQELVPWIVGLPRRSAPILGCNVVTDELEMSAIECPEGMPTAGGLEPERKMKVWVRRITYRVLPVRPVSCRPREQHTGGCSRPFPGGATVPAREPWRHGVS